MQPERNYSLLDRFCLMFDQTLRTITNHPHSTGEPYPGEKIAEADLSDHSRKHAAALMRINHAGEICAQALYHGQSLVSRNKSVKAKLQQAAFEEGDHLNWCNQRLVELKSHPSYLNPLWYGGSFVIGMMAGMVGDKWSLGFVVETERQVIEHLKKHLNSLPAEDHRSTKILEKMEQDETKHRDEALAAGAVELPRWIKKVMSFTSKVMVKTAYWV